MNEGLTTKKLVGNCNCRERLEKILAMQRDARDCLSEVVGPPIQESPDENEPVGSLASLECSLRSVERHAALLLGMVRDLHARL